LDEQILYITLLAFAFIGWYGAGALYNRRKSNKTMKSVWRTAKRYGVPGKLTSLGSSGFIINITEPTEKLRWITISLILSKRELPINWLVDALRGKRDTITIKATYKNKPRYEFNIFRVNNYFGKTLSTRYNQEDLLKIDDIYIYPRGEASKKKVVDAIDLMKKNREIWWISLSREGTHLITTCHVNITPKINTVLRYIDT